MKAVSKVSSRTVVLPTTDIDTDQIIAARFLTTTSRDGLGKNLFYDLRYDKGGAENTEFVLNQAQSKDCEILIAGRNFGCGSSREHAPWALLDYGFRAVISSEIADIFKSNALKNGLLPIVVDSSTHQRLLQTPGAELTIDVSAESIEFADGSIVTFEIEGFAKHCLLQGVDQLGYLQQQLKSIKQFEEQRAWKP